MSEEQRETGNVRAALWAGPIALGLFALVIAGMLAWKGIEKGTRGDLATATALAKLDLNAASEGELALLPKVGPAMAHRIVAYRQEHGPFQSVEQLDQCPDSESAAELLRPYVCVKNDGE